MMKQDARLLFCASVFALSSIIAFPISAQQAFDADLIVAEATQTDFQFGMATGATDGFDVSFDDRGDIPPFPGGGVVAYFQINAAPGDDKLRVDMRPVEVTAVWRLEIVGLAPNESTVVSWAPPVDGDFANTEFVFQSDDGSLGPIDMTAVSQTTVDQNGTYYIIYKFSNVNLPPIVRNDSYFMFTGAGASRDFDVLANDQDLDGDQTVEFAAENPLGTPSSGVGTVEIVTDAGGNQLVRYTPGAFRGEETFTYTAVDSDGATATATVTVNVNEHVFAERSHRSRATIGSQLDVELEIRHSGDLASLAVVETLPVGNLAGGAPVIWEYVDGSFSMEDAAAGITATQDGTLLIFDFGTNIPNSPLVFTYKVEVPEQQQTEKQFAGEVLYRLTLGEDEQTLDIPATAVLPGVFYHNADTSEDWRITVSEALRVLTLYNNNLYYDLNPDQETNPTVDGFVPSDTPSTLPVGSHHTADTDANGRITISEFLRVLTLYNNNLYYMINPDQGTAPTVDGYVPSDVPPEQ